MIVLVPDVVIHAKQKTCRMAGLCFGGIDPSGSEIRQQLMCVYFKVIFSYSYQAVPLHFPKLF